jgi:hypothetical protein
VAALYLRGTDVAQHAAFQFAPCAREAQVPEEDRRRFAQVVPQTYRTVEGFVGGILSRMGPQDALMVISDHGFAFQKKRGSYGHALEEAFTPEFRREHPPLEPVASYGTPQSRAATPAPSREVEEKIKEHLRGLGYFD